MQRASSLVSAAVQIGVNKHRVRQGEPALARAHLPFNRKEKSFGPDVVDKITSSAAAAGLPRGHLYALRDYLWRTGSRPEGDRKEEFVLTFNAARTRARDLVFDHLEAPRTAFDVWETICASVARASDQAQITRRELARQCRLSEREVTRHTQRLAGLGLLRLEQDGRGVRYVVLPVGDLGYPLWNGDRASRIDAASEAERQRKRDREPELSLPS